jgi:hypothetical protein
MSRSLLRPCIGCGRPVRGKHRCGDCQRIKDQTKRAKRPDLDDHRERERRRRLVADHRALLGDWCPGWSGRPAHPVRTLLLGESWDSSWRISPALIRSWSAVIAPRSLASMNTSSMARLHWPATMRGAPGVSGSFRIRAMCSAAQRRSCSIHNVTNSMAMRVPAVAGFISLMAPG